MGHDRIPWRSAGRSKRTLQRKWIRLRRHFPLCSFRRQPLIEARGDHAIRRDLFSSGAYGQKVGVLVLRMSALSQEGKLGPFLYELSEDRELDDMTKGTLAEIAEDPTFLLAVEDYLNRTEIFH